MTKYDKKKREPPMTTKSGTPREQLARASGLAPQLGKAADELNGRLVELEDAFQMLKLGVVASVPLYPNDDDPSETYQNITFGKDGKAWRLLYQYGDEICDEHKSVPLVNATREVRIQAAGQLAALLDRLIEVAEEEIARVQDKSRALAELAAEIRTAALKTVGV
jgi:hypothetical protein